MRKICNSCGSSVCNKTECDVCPGDLQYCSLSDFCIVGEGFNSDKNMEYVPITEFNNSF